MGVWQVASAEFSLFLVKDSLIDKADERFKSIMGWRDVDVFRRPLTYLFPADAHERLDRLLERTDLLLEGVTFPRVPLRVRSGGYVNFDMQMEKLGGGECRLDFFKPGKAEQDLSANNPPTDMYSFFNFVEELLHSPFDADVDLTMVSVDALREESGLSVSDREMARSEVVAGLQRKAVGGTLGKLDEASYGLITQGDFDENAFEQELVKVAEKLKLPADTFVPRTANIEIDDRDASSEDLQRALNHSRGVFLGEVEDEAGFGTLSGVIDGIAHNRKLIEDALKRYKYQTSARLISNAVAAVSLGQLQQGKVNLEGKIRLPDEIIVMADHPDLSLAHDMAQLEDLIRVRVRRPADQLDKPDFYELCRSTLIQESFFERLSEKLIKHNASPGHIGFRVKGMPPIKRGGLHWDSLNRLAALGHPVWIDRFGDAVIAPEAFGCLETGYVEVPHKLMRKLSEHFDGKELMEKLIAVWRSLDVGVLSADLPDYEMKSLAQELGITVTVEDSPEQMERLSA
ncbi:MAG: EAL domain-containing protein [Kordiimonas sp.]